MNVVFKNLSLEDLDATIDLCNRCFDESTSIDHAKEVFLRTMNDPNSIYINGVYNGRIIAHAKITIIETIYKPMESYIMINHLCVDPEFRRHHIATYLLDVIFEVAKERGCVEVTLWSKNFREAAHSCYKHYNFDIVDAAFFSKKVNNEN